MEMEMEMATAVENGDGDGDGTCKIWSKCYIRAYQGRPLSLG